jgi:hypothetical protein
MPGLRTAFASKSLFKKPAAGLTKFTWVLAYYCLAISYF